MFKAIIKRLRKDQRGLTLIELLVVIVILGIIAAIAIPMVMGNADTAVKNTNLQTYQIAVDAVNRYKVLNNNVNPTAWTQLTKQPDATDKGGPFIQTAPQYTNAAGVKVEFTLPGGVVTYTANAPGLPD